MNNKQAKEEIKEFFNNFPYNVMHESGKNNVEHYFVVITKEDTNSKVLTHYLDNYVKQLPLKDVSKQTLSYIKYNEDEYYFVMIGSIEHNDPYFSKKDEMMRKNANNIICYRILGEPANISTHIENKLENYLKTVEIFSSQVAILAKDKAKNKIIESKKIIEEKSPIIKKNIQEISKKLSNKIKTFNKKI